MSTGHVGKGTARDLFSMAWRQDRVLAGDACLEQAKEGLQDYNARRQADNLSMDDFIHLDFGISKLLHIAELHYLAANVRVQLEPEDMVWEPLPGWVDPDKPEEESHGGV